MCLSSESLGRARFVPRAARAPTAKYPLLHPPQLGLSHSDPLMAEPGRELGHSPAPVNKLPLPLPKACCLPALTLPVQRIPGMIPAPPYFFSFVYVGKA